MHRIPYSGHTARIRGTPTSTTRIDAGYAGLKRNVAVAMGNWLASVDNPPGEAVAVLQDALEDDEPLVREHAAWALNQTGSG